MTDLNTLIAVASYTKRFGVAVFRGSDLLFFAVKTLSLPRTPDRIKTEVSETISKLIQRFEPGTLLVKTPSERQRSAPTQALILNSIKQAAQKAGVTLNVVPMKDVQKQICADENASRKDAFAELKEFYPELARFTYGQNPSQVEYYQSMLSAAAIGLYWQKTARKEAG